jgi:hypothetical protein
MNAQQMSEQIMEYIGQNGDASFANLMYLFGEEAKGDRALEVLPNVILWANMSPTLIEALAAVKHLLEVHVTSVLVYLSDGQSLTLPIGKRVPKDGFDKPHWVPVLLRRRSDRDVR